MVYKPNIGFFYIIIMADINNLWFKENNLFSNSSSGGKVPQDRNIIRPKLRTVSLSLFISMCTISTIGVIWAILLLIFTFLQRHRRLVTTWDADKFLQHEPILENRERWLGNVQWAGNKNTQFYSNEMIYSVN